MPEAFDEDVINPTALAVHADVDTLALEPGDERLTGELAALIGVENLQLPVRVQCHLQSLQTESRIQAVRQFPRQHLPRVPVDDSD